MIRVIGERVDTLVGIDVGKRRDPSGLADLPPLGPSPFGPPTAELDLSPYLARLPVDVPPKLLAAVVVAFCFALGSGLAVAAIGPDPVARTTKHDAKPAAFAVEAEPEPEVELPRLAELMAEDPEPAVSSRETSELDAPAPARPARARTPEQVQRLRARRQARRRARIRARWVASHR